MSRHNIESVNFLTRKVASSVSPVKDDLGLKTPCVYSVPGECGLVYNGQTCRSTKTRVKQYHLHIRLEHPDKSAVAEHGISLDRLIQLQDSGTISTKSRNMGQMIREATP
jgi:hypothetical protein